MSTELKCLVRGNPMAPNMVMWSREGFDMTRVLQKYEEGIGTLYVETIEKTDSGRFTCTAHNGIGSATSRDVEVIVKCRLCTVSFNPLPKENSLDLSVWKSFADGNLTLSKQQILDRNKFADNSFKFNENGRKFFNGVENTVGKGEIAHFEHFLLLPLCFQKTCTADTLKPGLVWERVRCGSYYRVDNLMGKEENTDYQHFFLPFRIMFPKGFFLRVVKNLECWENG